MRDLVGWKYLNSGGLIPSPPNSEFKNIQTINRISYWITGSIDIE